MNVELGCPRIINLHRPTNALKENRTPIAVDTILLGKEQFAHVQNFMQGPLSGNFEWTRLSNSFLSPSAWPLWLSFTPFRDHSSIWATALASGAHVSGASLWKPWTLPVYDFPPLAYG
ncbi:hypothetical protein VNO77_04105 [Canavalia gladiata]|uniref:Uncharacterized protein n=1 Tax=Canavalia gladiata TaxID=3824 RepID=A0AAN9N132_CANGL